MFVVKFVKCYTPVDNFLHIIDKRIYYSYASEQEKLLKLIDEKNIGHLTLRDIGAFIGEKLSQKVKHHLGALERKGFISIDKKNGTIRRVNSSAQKNTGLFVSIPILGSANCGPATIFADENIEGYLKLSKRLVTGFKSMFAIKPTVIPSTAQNSG